MTIRSFIAAAALTAGLGIAALLTAIGVVGSLRLTTSGCGKPAAGYLVATTSYLA